MAKRIVVLIGSPRRNGNTEILADAFIKGAVEAGNNVSKIPLSQMDINGCLDCKHCTKNNGTCAQKDDMTQIYPELYRADMIVFATPIYFYGFSYMIKKVIDRMYTMTGKEFPITESVLLTPYADTDITVEEPIKAHYKALAGFMKWENKGIITVSGIDQKGDINGHACLQEAERLGFSIT